MAQAISCPQCEGKLSLRPELSGKRVVCPHCKNPFVAPAVNGAGPVATVPVAASAAGEMDFLDGLSASTSRSSASRPVGKTTGRTPGTTTGVLGRSKAKKKPPTELYIYGGIGAAVVLLTIVIAAVMLGSVGDSTKSSVPENVKWGLRESQRRQLFYQLIESVDNLGVGDNCRKNWQRIEEHYGVDRDVAAKILDEGFTAGTWREPDFPAGTAAARANRKEWIRARGLTGDHDPLL